MNKRERFILWSALLFKLFSMSGKCKETWWRSMTKTICFKIITTSITALFMPIGKAILIHLILTLVYLFYERVWNRINWGKIIE